MARHPPPAHPRTGVASPLAFDLVTSSEQRCLDGASPAEALNHARQILYR
ncbi:hypothetical protein ACQ4WX_38990 [Streptomyces lasalocidi]